MKICTKIFFTLFLIIFSQIIYAQSNISSSNIHSYPISITDSNNKTTGQPLLINYTVPASGATELVSFTLEIYWWEYLYKGTGFINIRKLENDSLVQQIDVLSSLVNIQYNYTSISLAPLEGGNYYVEIMPGTFWNLEGSAFAGTVKGNWNFSVHNYISIANGNWNNKSTWSGDLIPPYNARVTIQHNVVVTDDFLSCYSLKVLSPGSFTLYPDRTFQILQP